MCFEERPVECEMLFMDLVCIIVHLQNGFCAVWRTNLQMKLSLIYFTVIYMHICNFLPNFQLYPSVCIGLVADYIFVIKGILFSAFH